MTQNKQASAPTTLTAWDTKKRRGWVENLQPGPGYDGWLGHAMYTEGRGYFFPFRVR